MTTDFKEAARDNGTAARPAISNSADSCCGPSSCCGSAPVSMDPTPGKAARSPRKLSVELLYIDLDVCTRCRGADEALDAAIASAKPALGAVGVELDVRRILVETEEMAERLHLTTSPTIRVNGNDIQPGVEESTCESCGDLMAAGSVDCRVWNWRGQQYTSPPEGLIVEALMQAAVAPPATQVPGAEFNLPENLRSFFRNRKPKTSGCGCG